MKKTILTFAALLLFHSAKCWADDTVIFPETVSEDLNGNGIKLPQGVPAEHTLILLGFSHGQRNDIKGWISGLGLSDKQPWLEIPLIDDPGFIVRKMIRAGMESGITEPAMRAHVIPVFTDRDSFMRSLGIKNTDTVRILVIDRQGNILELATGRYDVQTGKKLMQALTGPQK